MALIKNTPHCALMLLNWLFMVDIYNCQRIDLVQHCGETSDDWEIIRKEIDVLSQVVKDQQVRINTLQGELNSVKQRVCQCK
jgi:hypothetical protein